MLCMIVSVTAIEYCTCAAACLEGQSMASNTPFEFIGLAHRTHTGIYTHICIHSLRQAQPYPGGRKMFRRARVVVQPAGAGNACLCTFTGVVVQYRCPWACWQAAQRGWGDMGRLTEFCRLRLSSCAAARCHNYEEGGQGHNTAMAESGCTAAAAQGLHRRGCLGNLCTAACARHGAGVDERSSGMLCARHWCDHKA